MDNRFFSLIVVPDSGNEVKYSRFNSQFLVAAFGILIAAFFTCLFFIVGYHVKLSQEQNYRAAVEKRQKLLNLIHKSEDRLSSLTSIVDDIQKNDTAFRLYASMKTLDHDMYKAGVGGHVIFDRSEFDNMAQDLVVRVERLTYGVTKLTSQTEIEQASMGEIRTQIRKNHEIIDSTPTFLPALTPYLNISSGYGVRTHPITGRRHFHNAIDIDGPRGDKNVAAAAGTVIEAARNGALGQCVVIRHKYGYETTYGHLDVIAVKVGQKIGKGEYIGNMGSTGRATGPHLHYCVTLNGQVMNPVVLLKSGL